MLRRQYHQRHHDIYLKIVNFTIGKTRSTCRRILVIDFKSLSVDKLHFNNIVKTLSIAWNSILVHQEHDTVNNVTSQTVS